MKDISLPTVFFVTGCLFAAFLPFLMLTFFTYPSTDDYLCYPYVFANGIIKTVKLFYFTFNGRYSSMLVLSVFYTAAAKFGLYGLLYKLVTALNLCFFVVSISYFFLRLFKEVGRPASFTLGLAVILFFNSISINISEYYYWLPASLMYVLGISLQCLFFCGFYFDSDTRLNRAFLFILAFFICGSIEPNIILFNLAFFGIIVLRWTNGRRPEGWILTLVAWILLLTLVELLSPGGRSRSGGHLQLHAQDPLFTLQATVSLAGRMIVSMFIHPATWLFSFFYLLVTRNSASFLSSQIYGKERPFLFLLFFYLPFLLVAALIFYAMGVRRLDNRVMSALTFLLVLAWVGQLELARPLVRPLLLRIRNISRVVGALSVLLVLAAFIRPSALSTAVDDLLSGDAAAYEASQLKRFRLIAAHSGDSLALPDLDPKPLSLYVAEDIGLTPDCFLNPFYARTYGKKAVWVESRDNPVQFMSYPLKADSAGILSKMK